MDDVRTHHAPGEDEGGGEGGGGCEHEREVMKEASEHRGVGRAGDRVDGNARRAGGQLRPDEDLEHRVRALGGGSLETAGNRQSGLGKKEMGWEVTTVLALKVAMVDSKVERCGW